MSETFGFDKLSKSTKSNENESDKSSSKVTDGTKSSKTSKSTKDLQSSKTSSQAKPATETELETHEIQDEPEREKSKEAAIPGSITSVTKYKKTVPESDKYPRIFLLEVILDRLQLSYCTEFMNRCYRGPNCITFRFLGKRPLTICQNEPVARECEETKTGSSLLFPMNVDEQEAARKSFILDFELYRDLPDGPLSLGRATLPITNLMKCVSAMCDTNEYRKALEKEELKRKPGCLPKPATEVFTESIHQTVVLMADADSTCDEAALMSLYVRLTCFGPVMMTECQLEAVGDDDLPSYVSCPINCTAK